MKEEDLNKVIDILEQNSSEEDAYFEFTYGNDDFFHVKSNKDGIVLFSKEILKTISSFSNTHNIERNYIKMNSSIWLRNDNIFAPFVEPVYVKRKDIELSNTEEKQPWKDKIVLIILVLVLIIFVIGFITGIVQIFHRIF